MFSVVTTITAETPPSPTFGGYKEPPVPETFTINANLPDGTTIREQKRRIEIQFALKKSTDLLGGTISLKFSYCVSSSGLIQRVQNIPGDSIAYADSWVSALSWENDSIVEPGPISGVLSYASQLANFWFFQTDYTATFPNDRIFEWAKTISFAPGPAWLAEPLYDLATIQVKSTSQANQKGADSTPACLNSTLGPFVSTSFVFVSLDSYIVDSSVGPFDVDVTDDGGGGGGDEDDKWTREDDPPIATTMEACVTTGTWSEACVE